MVNKTKKEALRENATYNYFVQDEQFSAEKITFFKHIHTLTCNYNSKYSATAYIYLSILLLYSSRLLIH